MKYWTRAEIDAGTELPEDLNELVTDVIDELENSRRKYPRVSRVGARHDGDEHKEYFYEVEVELAPGLVLPSYCGYVEMIEEGWGDNDIDSHRKTVMEGMPICLAQRERLEDLVHDVRMRARRAVAAHNVVGLPTRLVDVTLAPYDYWRGGAEPKLLVHLEALGSGLVPMIWEISIEKAEDLENELVSWWDTFAERSRVRTELLGLGASGWISQLALNAIAHHGEVVGSLQRFENGTRFWLPDDTALIFHHGRVEVRNGYLASEFRLQGDGFTAPSACIDAGLLSSAVGRPATGLIDHPFLSPDMLVTSVSNSFEDGIPVVKVGLDMPHRLFCSTSGRVWDEPGSEMSIEPEASGRVVAFRRRAI